MKTPSKPKPKIVSEVCSLCGLDWRLHGDEATTDVCIRLLAAEVASLRAQLNARPIGFPVPYPQPYPLPYRPWHPWWSNTSGGNWNQAASHTTALTPHLSNATPRAISVSSVGSNSL